jgi:hypothetical protein
MNRSRNGLATTAVLALGLTACGGGDDDATGTTPDAAPPAAPLTYWHDVKPILDAKCVGCHVEGGIAPFALDAYAGARDNAVPAKAAVEARIMPPWLAGGGCNTYFDDRSLTDEQIAVIGEWADEGAKEGDPADEGAPLDTGPSHALSRVDLNLPMAAPHTPTVAPDEYRCFVLDWPATTRKFITGFRANPGEPAIVHHVIAYYAAPADVAAVQALESADPEPGYTCFGGPGINTGEWLGAWAPGTPGYDFPAGTGLAIEPGSKIILQVHYHAGGATGFVPDQTSIDLKLDDTVAKEATLQPFTNPRWLQGQMPIAAGDADATYSFAYDLTQYVSGGAPIDLWSVGYHQHVRGSHGRVELRHPDGTSDCLLDVPRWDFHWQGGYRFAEPERMNPGDQLYLECHWDNSAAHQPVVGGTQVAPMDLNWGEGTNDEMCLTAVYLTPAD